MNQRIVFKEIPNNNDPKKLQQDKNSDQNIEMDPVEEKKDAEITLVIIEEGALVQSKADRNQIENTQESNDEVNRTRNKKYLTMWFYNIASQQQQQGFGSPDPEERQLMPYSPQSRNHFIKRVMTIVFVMLMLTSGVIIFVLSTPSVKEFFRDSQWWLLLTAFLLVLIVDYGMICSPCTRRPPCNFIFLFLAVVGMSVISSKITAHYRTDVILYATIATTVVVFVCVLLACSNFDFTSYLLYVIVIATAFSAIVMVVLFVMLVGKTPIKPLWLAMLVIGTLIQVILLTIQLQTILGGRTVELSDNDYALGAFMLYMSIIDIFLKMVQIIGISSEM